MRKLNHVKKVKIVKYKFCIKKDENRRNNWLKLRSRVIKKVRLEKKTGKEMKKSKNNML